ncbi:hypothetical protein TNCV_1314701 [Trichonephila clavipes]|uniref:Uncharacterized protein n=1 Tax=Trichonephila clavipes TaxID=2585209 RepID=A0A8X6SLL5_TRICX|nr:hypothetical protein TNCV_1314701 [Trichonephila clavipes]
MPPNTLRMHTEYVLVNSVDPKVSWAVAEKPRVEENISLPSLVPCLNSGGGDRWCRHLSCKSPTCLRLWQHPFLPFGKNMTATTGCPDLKYPKVMAYYYGSTHQNVNNCSSVDWKTL